MSNLTQRLITGTIFVIVLVGCIWWSAWSMSFLFLVITVLGLWEFYQLSHKANAQPLSIYGTILGGLIVISAFLAVGIPRYGLLLFLFLLPFGFLIFFIELFRKKQNPFGNIAWTMAGLIYVALPMALLIATFTPYQFLSYLLPKDLRGSYEPAPVLTFFILIWVSDSMAYVCGRLFGKHKLWERISPKKTWEGFIGGLLFCGATGHFLGLLWLSDHDHHVAILWTIIAVVISVTGMLGDLVESLFKRSIDVKDSGTILPGHGGILDRFDALFLSVPFAITTYWLLGGILR